MENVFFFRVSVPVNAWGHFNTGILMELNAVRLPLPHKDSVKLHVFDNPRVSLTPADTQPRERQLSALFPEPWEVQDHVEGIARHMT